MKKVLLIGAVAILALSSCAKDRTCVCTDNDTEEKTSIEIPKSTKKNAESACEVYEGGGSNSCELD